LPFIPLYSIENSPAGFSCRAVFGYGLHGKYEVVEPYEQSISNARVFCIENIFPIAHEKMVHGGE